jgi:hypothetical protein
MHTSFLIWHINQVLVVKLYPILISHARFLHAEYIIASLFDSESYHAYCNYQLVVTIFN